MNNIVVLIVMLVSVAGCNQSPSEFEDEEPSKNSEEPDYTGVYVEDIQEDRLIVQPLATDPEASYPVYEIYVDEHTELVGEAARLDEIEVEDEVEIWVHDKGAEKEIAEKIFVQ
ncbi:hypothetical protein [Halobacillus salinus]|uniref:hypothetical protein n=1 Tax=Halobacillus salinus TaxID=192814 RepID=UPI0009A75C43|nr:hypothetical protein [Halobacillus salinus]